MSHTTNRFGAYLRYLYSTLAQGRSDRSDRMYELTPEEDLLFGREDFLCLGLWKRSSWTKRQASEHLCRTLGRLAAVSKTDRVLDVGCGFGDQAVLYARELAPRSYLGIDITPRFVEAARRKAEQAGIGPSVGFEVVDARALPYADGSFDVIVANESLQHIKTREAFLAEAYRVLAPGGRLVASDHIADRLPRSFWMRVLVRLGFLLWQYPYANFYGGRVYRLKLESVGFRDCTVHSVREDTVGGFIRYAKRRIREAVAAGTTSASELRHARATLSDFKYEYKIKLMDYVLVRAVRPADHAPKRSKSPS